MWDVVWIFNKSALGGQAAEGLVGEEALALLSVV